jgi:hypothetical protein
MAAGRRRKAEPETLYAFAHQFYWDFRRLSEGGRRRRFNQEKYEQLSEDLDDLQLIDDEDKARHQAMVDEEIRAGSLDPSRRNERLHDIEEAELSARRDFYCQQAHLEATQAIRIPGEREVIEVLLSPKTTAVEIRELCKEATMTRSAHFQSGVFKEIEVPAWPIPLGSTLPTYLTEYAEEYISALNDPRFPSCDVAARPSTRLKQFWFLARALAGALYGVKTRTAINLVGSLRPEEAFNESHDAKPPRRRVRRKYKRRGK